MTTWAMFLSWGVAAVDTFDKNRRGCRLRGDRLRFLYVGSQNRGSQVQRESWNLQAAFAALSRSNKKIYQSAVLVIKEKVLVDWTY